MPPEVTLLFSLAILFAVGGLLVFCVSLYRGLRMGEVLWSLSVLPVYLAINGVFVGAAAAGDFAASGAINVLLAFAFVVPLLSGVVLLWHRLEKHIAVSTIVGNGLLIVSAVPCNLAFLVLAMSQV